MLKRYVRQLGPLVLLLAACVGIFAAVFSLYSLPREPVLYASSLCAVLGLTALALHFRRYFSDHRTRQHVLKNRCLDITDLPCPRTLAEEEDQQMIRLLRQDLNAAEAAAETEKRLFQDYYTAWVHQVKTPIAVMRLMLQEEDTDEHRALQAELFRVEQYVDMALCYARLNSSGNDLVLRRVNVDRVIRQAIRDYAPQFIRRRLRLNYQPRQAEALTDEKWLLFILEQLLSNAVKYTPSGTVTVELTEELILRVKDTGIGIAPEDLPRIGERGFTGYNGRGGVKSTGLGLYLCCQAAKLLGHRLTITSEVGVGTTVSLELARENVEVV